MGVVAILRISLGQFQAIHHGHRQIGNDQVRAAHGEFFEGLDPVLCDRLAA